MTDTALSLLEPAIASAHDLIAALEPEHWRLPTPCEAWNVRAVVEHLVRGQHVYSAILAGEDGRQLAADMMSRGNHLEPDPVIAFDLAAGRLTAAFNTPGALERHVAHPMAVIPSRRLPLMTLMELTVHGWDIAVATGSPGPVDASVVDLLVTSSSTWMPPEQTSYFAAPAAAVRGSRMEMLLGLTGRDAGALRYRPNHESRPVVPAESTRTWQQSSNAR